MRKFLLMLLALTSLVGVSPALAQDSALIVQARRTGLIGERFYGYLGFVATP
jgi:uncharacterized protein YdbL (DUF1318 family)